MTYAQVTAALEPCGDDLNKMADAVYQMARKAYCKAAKLPTWDIPAVLAYSEIRVCMDCVWHFGHQAVCRMATFLIDESARAGELNG